MRTLTRAETQLHARANRKKKYINSLARVRKNTAIQKSARLFLICSNAFKSDLLWTKGATKPGREVTCPYMFADGGVASNKKGLLQKRIRQRSNHAKMHDFPNFVRTFAAKINCSRAPK